MRERSLAAGRGAAVTTEAQMDFGGAYQESPPRLSRICQAGRGESRKVDTGHRARRARPAESGSVDKTGTARPSSRRLSRPHFSDHVTAIGFASTKAEIRGSGGSRRTWPSSACPMTTKYPASRGHGADYEIVFSPVFFFRPPGRVRGVRRRLYDFRPPSTPRTPSCRATVSRGPVSSGQICGPGVFVRVDHFRAFLIAKAVEAATECGYPTPSGRSFTKAVPDAGAGSDARNGDAHPSDDGFRDAAPSRRRHTTTSSACAGTAQAKRRRWRGGGSLVT